MINTAPRRQLHFLVVRTPGLRTIELERKNFTDKRSGKVIDSVNFAAVKDFLKKPLETEITS